MSSNLSKLQHGQEECISHYSETTSKTVLLNWIFCMMSTFTFGTLNKLTFLNITEMIAVLLLET